MNRSCGGVFRRAAGRFFRRALFGAEDGAVFELQLSADAGRPSAEIGSMTGTSRFSVNRLCEWIQQLRAA